MPWRNIPEWVAHLPEWGRWLLTLLAFLIAAGIGTVAKIVDDIKQGERDRFWTKKLYLELPAVAMMALTGAAVSEHFELSHFGASAVTAILGWGGPKALTALLAAYVSGGKDRR